MMYGDMASYIYVRPLYMTCDDHMFVFPELNCTVVASLTVHGMRYDFNTLFKRCGQC